MPLRFHRCRVAISGGRRKQRQSRICFLPAIGRIQAGPQQWKALSAADIRRRKRFCRGKDRPPRWFVPTFTQTDWHGGLCAPRMLAINPFERLCANKSGTNTKSTMKTKKKDKQEFFVLFGWFCAFCRPSSGTQRETK